MFPTNTYSLSLVRHAGTRNLTYTSILCGAVVIAAARVVPSVGPVQGPHDELRSVCADIEALVFATDPATGIDYVRPVGHWHVGHNMPGYLCDGAVSTVADTGDAWQVWHSEVTHALDTVTDDGVFLDVDTARNLITERTLDDAGYASVDIAGYTYWVQRCTAVCESDDDSGWGSDTAYPLGLPFAAAPDTDYLD